MHQYVLYIIYAWVRLSHGMCIKTYIGITNNLRKRLQQHRGLRKGGAKFTTRYSNIGAEWKLAGLAHGFPSHQEVLQAEWAMQNPNVSRHFKERKKVGKHDLAGILSNLIYLTQCRSHSHIWTTLHELPVQTRQELQTKGSPDIHSFEEPVFYNQKTYTDFVALAKPSPKARPQKKKKKHSAPPDSPKPQRANAKALPALTPGQRLAEKFKSASQEYARQLSLLE